MFFVNGFIVPWDAVFLKNGSGLLALQLGNLYFTKPIFMAFLVLFVFVESINELDWIRGVTFEFNNNGFLAFNLCFQIKHLLLRLLDVAQLLGLLSEACLEALLEVGCLLFSSGQLIFQFLQTGDRVGRRNFEDQQLVVAVVNVFYMLLILDLQLMEINEFEFFAHFVLVLDLCLLLNDGSLE